MRDNGDPRLTDRFVRVLPGGSGENAVLLIGVVHDHPASTYRVEAIVEAADPGVLALELPPFALPLFERYAEDRRTPPAFGGEMSMAIKAASDADVVGIDGPSAGFVLRLGRTLHRDDVAAATARKVLRSLSAVTWHAMVCRIAAALARIGVRLAVDSPSVHDCRWSDDPGEQADHEREHIRRATAISGLLGAPDAVSLVEATREEHMAERLSTLRRRTDVVAVVGLGHLDPLAERLGRAR